MLCKVYSFIKGISKNNPEIKEVLDDEYLYMPSMQLEDKNGQEIFLYDVLLDENEDGWIVYFHEKGYICLSKIGSTTDEPLIPVMNILGNFGKHFYTLPMEVVGNKYVDKIENSYGAPISSRNKFKRFLKNRKRIDCKNEVK